MTIFLILTRGEAEKFFRFFEVKISWRNRGELILLSRYIIRAFSNLVETN